MKKHKNIKDILLYRSSAVFINAKEQGMTKTEFRKVVDMTYCYTGTILALFRKLGYFKKIKKRYLPTKKGLKVCEALKKLDRSLQAY